MEVLWGCDVLGLLPEGTYWCGALRGDGPKIYARQAVTRG